MMHYKIVPFDFGDIAVFWKEKTAGPSVVKILLPGENKKMEEIAREDNIDLDEKTVPAIDAFCSKVSAYLRGSSAKFPLSLLETQACYSFQKRVLLADHEIPRGRVSSYSGLALRLGAPRAARAVGTALARNPFPLVIPCHRVVRSDGSLGGFGGGLQMKRALLEMEGVGFDSKGRVGEKYFW